jgi:hypothetical protein
MLKKRIKDTSVERSYIGITKKESTKDKLENKGGAKRVEIE